MDRGAGEQHSRAVVRSYSCAAPVGPSGPSISVTFKRGTSALSRSVSVYLDMPPSSTRRLPRRFGSQSVIPNRKVSRARIATRFNLQRVAATRRRQWEEERRLGWGWTTPGGACPRPPSLLVIKGAEIIFDQKTREYKGMVRLKNSEAAGLIGFRLL